MACRAWCRIAWWAKHCHKLSNHMFLLLLFKWSIVFQQGDFHLHPAIFKTRAQYFGHVIEYVQNCQVERNKKHKTWFQKTEAETTHVGSSCLTPPGLNNPSISLVRLWHLYHQFTDLTGGGLSRRLAARHAMCWNTRMKLAVLKIVTTSITLSKSLADSRCCRLKKQETINLTQKQEH